MDELSPELRKVIDSMREGVSLEPRPEPTAAEYRAEALEDARKRYPRWLNQTGIPERYRAIEWDDSLLMPRCLAWSSGLPDSRSAASGLFYGPPGCGKTSAAIWILRQAYRYAGFSVRNDAGVWNVPSARFISCSDLFGYVFEKRHEELEALKTAGLLVIDDLGIAHESDYPIAALDRIIDARWSEMRPTIVTTNLYATLGECEEAIVIAKRNGAPAPELESFHGRYPRAFSRLQDRGGMGLIRFPGRDLRKAATK